MSGTAYIDSSCIVAIVLEEASAAAVTTRLARFSTAMSHPLLDAEVRSTCAREGVAIPTAALASIELVQLERPLSEEIDRVLAAGYVRGADCFHLATALHLSPDTSELTFLTLDLRQRAVAKKLGFRT